MPVAYQIGQIQFWQTEVSHQAMGGILGAALDPSQGE